MAISESPELSGLDGLRTTDEIEEDLRLPVTEIRRLLRALLAVGGLEDAACIPNAMRWAVQSERDVAGRRFGAALHTYRTVEAAFIAIDRRERLPVTVLGNAEMCQLVAESLAAAGLSLCSTGAALAILADSAHEEL